MSWENKNKSFSFNMLATTSLKQLSSFKASEVLISNKTGQDLYIYDNNYSTDDRRFLLKNSESMVLRGITNTANVSAKTGAASGTVYFRSAYFSNFNQLF